MNAMPAQLIAAYIFFFIAVLTGVLAIIAKNLWRDKTKTQILAYIAIVATVLFMILVWPYLPE